MADDDGGTYGGERTRCFGIEEQLMEVVLDGLRHILELKKDLPCFAASGNGCDVTHKRFGDGVNGKTHLLAFGHLFGVE